MTWQNQQSECAPSRDSDQPGHPPSLIRVFAVRMKKLWVLNYPLSAQRRLWSDWADAQADLSLRWAHTHFVVLSWCGSNSLEAYYSSHNISYKLCGLKKYWSIMKSYICSDERLVIMVFRCQNMNSIIYLWIKLKWELSLIWWNNCVIQDTTNKIQ